MQKAHLTGHCTSPCDCSILNHVPCPPRVVNYTSFCEFATKEHLSLCVIEKIARSCSIPKPWVPCIAITTSTTIGPTSTADTSTTYSIAQHDEGQTVCRILVLLLVALIFFLCLGQKYKWNGKTKVYHFYTHVTTFTARFIPIGRNNQEIPDVKLTYSNKNFTVELPPMNFEFTEFPKTDVTPNRCIKDVMSVEYGYVETVNSEDTRNSNTIKTDLTEHEENGGTQNHVEPAGIATKAGLEVIQDEIVRMDTTIAEESEDSFHAPVHNVPDGIALQKLPTYYEG